MQKNSKIKAATVAIAAAMVLTGAPTAVLSGVGVINNDPMAITSEAASARTIEKTVGVKFNFPGEPSSEAMQSLIKVGNRYMFYRTGSFTQEINGQEITYTSVANRKDRAVEAKVGEEVGVPIASADHRTYANNLREWVLSSSSNTDVLPLSNITFKKENTDAETLMDVYVKPVKAGESIVKFTTARGVEYTLKVVAYGGETYEDTANGTVGSTITLSTKEFAPTNYNFKTGSVALSNIKSDSFSVKLLKAGQSKITVTDASDNKKVFTVTATGVGNITKSVVGTVGKSIVLDAANISPKSYTFDSSYIKVDGINDTKFTVTPVRAGSSAFIVSDGLGSSYTFTVNTNTASTVYDSTIFGTVGQTASINATGYTPVNYSYDTSAITLIGNNNGYLLFTPIKNCTTIFDATDSTGTHHYYNIIVGSGSDTIYNSTVYGTIGTPVSLNATAFTPVSYVYDKTALNFVNNNNGYLIVTPMRAGNHTFEVVDASGLHHYYNVIVGSTENGYYNAIITGSIGDIKTLNTGTIIPTSFDYDSSYVTVNSASGNTISITLIKKGSSVFTAADKSGNRYVFVINTDVSTTNTTSHEVYGVVGNDDEATIDLVCEDIVPDYSTLNYTTNKVQIINKGNKVITVKLLSTGTATVSVSDTKGNTEVFTIDIVADKTVYNENITLEPYTTSVAMSTKAWNYGDVSFRATPIDVSIDGHGDKDVLTKIEDGKLYMMNVNPNRVGTATVTAYDTAGRKYVYNCNMSKTEHAENGSTTIYKNQKQTIYLPKNSTITQPLAAALATVSVNTDKQGYDVWTITCGTTTGQGALVIDTTMGEYTVTVSTLHDQTSGAGLHDLDPYNVRAAVDGFLN